MKKLIALTALLCMVLTIAVPAGAAVTFTKLQESVMGNLRAVLYQVSFDESYPTGGEDISKIT